MVNNLHISKIDRQKMEKKKGKKVTMYVLIQPHHHEQDMTQGQFLAEFNWLEFRVFPLLDWQQYQG